MCATPSELFEGRGHNIYNEVPERCIARFKAFAASVMSQK